MTTQTRLHMLAINDILKKHENVLKEQAVLGVVKSNVRSEILTYILMESAH